MGRIILITAGCAAVIITFIGGHGILHAQTPSQSDSLDTIYRSGAGIPFNSGALYLQNFFRSPWHEYESERGERGTSIDSVSIMGGVGAGKSFSMQWLNASTGYTGPKEPSFITYSRTSVALGTASAVAIWGTIAARSWRDKNNVHVAAATAAAALNIYQGLKLWKNVSANAKAGP